MQLLDVSKGGEQVADVSIIHILNKIINALNLKILRREIIFMLEVLRGAKVWNKEPSMSKMNQLPFS